MYYGKTEADLRGQTHGPAEPAAMSVVQDALVSLATGLDARFVRAGATLASMLETIEHMVKSLDGVMGALGPNEAGAAVANLTEVATRLSELPAAGAHRERELADVRLSTDGLQDNIFQIRDILRVLRIFGVNIKIAASNDTIFVDLAQHIFNRLDAGEKELAPLIQSITKVQQDLRRANKTEKMLAEEAQKVLPAAPRQLLQDAAGLRDYQASVAGAAASVSTVARAVQAKAVAVLGALQIGDITRQRLEHVFAGLQLLQAHLAQSDDGDAEKDSLRAHILGLMIDQLSDTATDFHREAGILASSLEGIGSDAHDLLRLDSGSGADSGGSSMLHRLESGISNVAQLTQQLRTANDELATIGRTIVLSVDDLGERIRVVSNLRADVEQIAINARLRCHRAGADGRAVAVIAVEVRSYASQLDSVIGNIETHLRALDGTSKAMRERGENAEQADASEILESSLRSIRGACRTVEASMGAAGFDTRQVIEMLDATTRDVQGELEIGNAVNQLIVRLAGMTPASARPAAEGDVATEALLDQIARLYTMAREREIHRRFAIGGAAEEAEAAAPQGGALSEDDLFDDALF